MNVKKRIENLLHFIEVYQCIGADTISKKDLQERHCILASLISARTQYRSGKDSCRVLRTQAFSSSSENSFLPEVITVVFFESNNLIDSGLPVYILWKVLLYKSIMFRKIPKRPCTH